MIKHGGIAVKKKNKILLLISVFVIILIILIFILKLQEKKENPTSNIKNNTQAAVSKEDEELARLQNMNEYERMRFYFSKYLNNIEDGNIETAYNMLYDEFKNTYFPTLDDYKNYVNEKYPDIIAVNYNNFQREGKYYILSTTIQNPVTNSNFAQKFVIVEYGFNDFKLSFQAE